MGSGGRPPPFVSRFGQIVYVQEERPAGQPGAFFLQDGAARPVSVIMKAPKVSPPGNAEQT